MRSVDDLVLLQRAAGEAARIALGYFRQDPEVFWKEGNSPVSQADLAVDGFLRDFLLSARPRYGWVSEETAAEPPSGSEERFFVVDPIDGTRSFLRGETTWCVALAVIEGGRPTHGVIHAPVTGEIFTAFADGPAQINGQELAQLPQIAGERMTLSLPDGVRRRLRPVDAARIDLAASIPSLAYRLAQVARGRLDGTIVQPRANDWDIAAADLILDRAGGALLNGVGQHHNYNLTPRRHGLLIAGGKGVLPRLQEIAASLHE
ncbi:3'(2'),5'-bisphosphate nucleotidase CysQ [Aureimonas altamirensis]|uniref:3'(2'),5'-bisphosphate nucleotidase CysQ n=1 Tax=Aureimonas altamirensis TaxID=370622 RepID=UPI003019EE70